MTRDARTVHAMPRTGIDISAGVTGLVWYVTQLAIRPAYAYPCYEVWRYRTNEDCCDRLSARVVGGERFETVGVEHAMEGMMVVQYARMGGCDGGGSWKIQHRPIARLGYFNL